MQVRKYLAAIFAALLLTGASVAKAALPPIDVTWNPGAAGITGLGNFTFDNVVLNTYMTIDITGTNFTEQGFLRMSVFTDNGNPTGIPSAGIPGGTPYSLYVQFTGAGTQTPGIPSTGTFTSLNYQMFGASGIVNFTDGNNDGIFTASGGGAPVLLASGSLLSPPSGSASTAFDPNTGLLISSQVLASFNPNPAVAGFFVNPSALQALDVTAAFTSTGTVITQNAGGVAGRFRIDGGGGNATFAISAVPEPDTYGMLLAGLGLFAFVARRKSKRETA